MILATQIWVLMCNVSLWTNGLFAGYQAAIALLKEHPQMLHHVYRVGRPRLRICAPIEAELWFGVAKSARQEQNRSRLPRRAPELSPKPIGRSRCRMGRAAAKPIA